MSASGKRRVLALFTPDRKRFLTRVSSIWLWCCAFGLCQVHLLDALWWSKVFANTGSLKVQTPDVWVLSHLCRHCRRVHKYLANVHKHPCPLLHSSLLAQQECPSSVSDQWRSVASYRILLFRCHRSLMLRRMLVLMWCWKGLPSGGWWWACWRLGYIPWQCSWCPCEQEIQCHARVYLLFPLKKILCPSSVIVSPKFFHLISQIPRMFHLYLSISCVGS